jgi:hypothetical protein
MDCRSVDSAAMALLGGPIVLPFVHSLCTDTRRWAYLTSSGVMLVPVFQQRNPTQA